MKKLINTCRCNMFNIPVSEPATVLGKVYTINTSRCNMFNIPVSEPATVLGKVYTINDHTVRF